MDELIDEDDEVLNENNLSGYESEKENYTFGAGNQAQQRLFGEVNVSAIGSSGVIPEDRLNLPVSDTSFGTTEILMNSEIQDSFESEVSATPRQKSQKSQAHSAAGLRFAADSTGQSITVDQLNNRTFDAESQSLGMSESLLENLNVRSMAGSLLRSDNGDYFTASKRKPSSEDSDGSQGSSSQDRPTIKRFKSHMGIPDSAMDQVTDDAENALFAHIPSIGRVQSKRQIDDPVEKSVYWLADDRKSWHLQYPEMTQLQLDAFMQGAAARGEEFSPGKSGLWDLAMKYFPPTHYEEMVSRLSETGSNDGRAARRSTSEPVEDEDMPPTAGLSPAAAPTSAQQAPFPLESTTQDKRIVATLKSTPVSVIQGICINVTDSTLSWGRALENTRVYEHRGEARVPKYGFRIILWKEGYDPSRLARPWTKGLVENDEEFHFYISTKATQGIHVNGVTVPSSDSKNPYSASRFWLRLHDGDKIIVWHNGEQTKAELVFRCEWGGSAHTRLPLNPASSTPAPPTFFASDAVARRLDEVCARAERKAKSLEEYELKLEDAHRDKDERTASVARERERSRAFELRRLEACRVLALRIASRRVSPASAPPTTASTDDQQKDK
jgi:hypothetical protein